jgi:hypothetical protein
MNENHDALTGYSYKAPTQLVSHIFRSMSVYLTQALVSALGIYLPFIKEISGGVTTHTERMNSPFNTKILSICYILTPISNFLFKT